MKNSLKTILIATALITSASSLRAQIIEELLINPPGTDNGSEFLEISGTPSAALTDVWFVEIDGDSTNSGLVNTALNLTGQTIGTNGLFLVRDSATVLTPAPDAGTTVFVSDFAPDIQNGTGTYLLVTNFTGAVSNDLDAGTADGILDSTPWTTVLSAISKDDGGASDFVYAAQLGGTHIPYPGFEAELIYRKSGVYYGGNVSGTAPGPFTVDPGQSTDPGFVGYTATPGSPVGSSVSDWTIMK